MKTNDVGRNGVAPPGLRKFLRIVEDFEKLSGGPFREKYPDCGVHEGYGYVARKGRNLRAALAASGDADRREG